MFKSDVKPKQTNTLTNSITETHLNQTVGGQTPSLGVDEVSSTAVSLSKNSLKSEINVFDIENFGILILLQLSLKEMTSANIPKNEKYERSLEELGLFCKCQCDQNDIIMFLVLRWGRCKSNQLVRD